jgi:hypothetical protein
MRHASADPDRQPLHAAASSDRMQADTAAPFRHVRHEAGAAEHALPWPSESGIELHYPARLVWPSPWVGHIPFAMWLVDALRPRMFVELGVHSGNSYCAFLQAIQFLSVPAQCYGVDHWRGDEHSDSYPEDVYTELRGYHHGAYGTFSTLLRSTFHDALAYFSDEAVDLLHLDGFHAFEAVSSDLSDWLPKMSARGVVLLHDISVREREFGVWRVWEELTGRYETFSFTHSHGLGVAYVGSEPPPPALRTLLTLKDADRISRVRTYFARLGTSLEDRFDGRQAEIRAERLPGVEAALEATREEVRQHAQTVESRRAEIEASAARVSALDGALNASRADVARHGESVVALQQELAAARADAARHVDLLAAAQRERIALRAEAARRVEEAERLRREIASLRAEIVGHHDASAAVEGELTAVRADTARHAETAAALQRELDAAQADAARHLGALEGARANADAANEHIADLEGELARTRAQISAALAQRERATLLLREQMVTTAALRRQLAGLRREP